VNENSELKENISVLRTQLAEREEKNMYPLILLMYYSDEYVSQMCLVLNSLTTMSLHVFLQTHIFSSLLCFIIPSVFILFSDIVLKCCL
jgi:hypothetical protein